MLTQFEVAMITRTVEALGRIADELARIRALMETKTPEGATEGKDGDK